MRTSQLLSSVAGALSLSLLFGAATNAAPLFDPYVGVSLGAGKGSVNVFGQDVKPSGFIGSIKAGVDYNANDRFSIGPFVDYFPGQGLFGSTSFGCGCRVAVDPIAPLASAPASPSGTIVQMPSKPRVVSITGSKQVHMKAGALAYGFRGSVKFGSDKSWSLFALGGRERTDGVVKISYQNPRASYQYKIQGSGNGLFVGGGIEKRIGPHWSTAIKIEHASITFDPYNVTEGVNIVSTEVFYHF